MNENWPDDLRAILVQKKEELDSRLARITSNVRRGLDTDSEERATQLEDNDVVDALGNEAREEIDKVSAALRRMDSGEYGLCIECGDPVGESRIRAYPYANECIDCATIDEEIRARRN
jgi:RNA polymerase-binding transcription factor